MKKLGVNTAAGVLDIIGTIIYLLAIFVIVGTAVDEAFTSGSVDTASTLSTLLLVYAAVSVAVHIAGLVLSKRSGMKLAGNILESSDMLFIYYLDQLLDGLL